MSFTDNPRFHWILVWIRDAAHRICQHHLQSSPKIAEIQSAFA
jgi:hypothetical protein